MNNSKIIIALILIIILFSSVREIFAGDTVVVQTLTFDDITKRRGIWQFPDSSERFRKILMYYTLKCDPRTTHDKYNCGEWDYLTYNTVYVKTGEYDSTLLTNPLYQIGRMAPDTIFYRSEPTFTTRKSYKIEKIVDSIISSNEYQFGNGSEEILITPGYHRIQFIFDKNILRDSGLAGGYIERIKLYFNKSGVELNELRIKMTNSSATEPEKFISDNMEETLFLDNFTTTEGWNLFDMTYPLRWNRLSNLVIEISFNTADDSEEFSIISNSDASIIHASGSDGYLVFDGVNDYVHCGDIEELDGTSQFTFETWVRIDNWRSWNNIIGKGDKVLLQMGNNEGQIYCIIRNPDNTHGNVKYAVELGEWTHLAMVFDGTKKTNEEKLRLFVNGEEKTLDYNNNIPETTPDQKGPFQLTDISGNNTAMQGALDEVRIWKKPLSGELIKEWMGKEIDNFHPDYQDLLAYYPLDDGNGFIAEDTSENNFDGNLIGIPEWSNYKADEIVKNSEIINKVPNVIFEMGEYVSRLDSIEVEEEVQDIPVSIVKYKIEDRRAVIDSISYVWLSGWGYAYNPDGEAIDSIFYNYDDYVINDTLEYYDEPFEVVDPYEIGRFITPYGIGLDLGPDGFTWIYDVTDYAPLLRGEVDFSAGNQQELIDVRFEFIKGIPPRDVLRIDRPWGARKSYRYKNLDNDENLSAATVSLHPEAKQFMMRTRLTGHGHNSDDGNYPHCCEWKDNTHYLYVNGDERAKWHIWRYYECGFNPVYPQGGTWPGRREGWCPGDIVYDYDFEITDLVSSDSVIVDYGITPVPQDNQGMGNGNYHIAMQLFEYSDLNHEVDAEVYTVMAPNRDTLYSRFNPICKDPTVVIRNNGRETITSLSFEYYVSGGEHINYDWTGRIKSMEKDTIVLPIYSGNFWLGDDNNIFTVKIGSPNGNGDEYAENDSYSTQFVTPDLYNEQIVLWYKTNNRPEHFTYQIRNIHHEDYIFTKENLLPNTLYKDTITFPDGCYTLELLDAAHYGLSYWAYPEQGSGYFKIFDINDKLLKNFDPDFGYGLIYSFGLGDITYVKDRGLDFLINVFPNPTDDEIRLHLDHKIGKAELRIFDNSGNLVLKDNINVNGEFDRSYSTSNLPSGSYNINIFNEKYNLNRRFVLRK
jgi:hypothetical protein